MPTQPHGSPFLGTYILKSPIVSYMRTIRIVRSDSNYVYFDDGSKVRHAVIKELEKELGLLIKV